MTGETNLHACAKNHSLAVFWLALKAVTYSCTKIMENFDKLFLQLRESSGEGKFRALWNYLRDRSCLCALATTKGFVIGGVESTIRIYERSYDSKEVNCL